MKHLTNRRTVLLAAGLLVTGTATGAEAIAVQSTDISGTVQFEDNAVIPKGHIKIYLKDPAIQANARELATKTQIKSAGKSKTIAFSFSLPASAIASPTLQVVARMEREDGWLLARGSAKIEVDAPVEITLYTAMY
ncbi:hypothetical protein [Pseudovibrio sp. Tun.PSC04-5.I4]|uniref:hypothetical protein n=1 Tax=Pseudovibrio sp. Tun.PSC04-5.I4 TaxID=1798213 RepID=UPI0008803E20|nr:hypothetical protein [Pseudovibrio sp. Tun.PSC04-5.I4]SDQ13696.1 hypothetical protein SAMN04515695_0113 [Pseudovibrio sp. Tun.PSC04-5.I4]